ncbi:uncharacterized protein ACNLHF_016074 isoform 1-T1 [Anomaloglossus baeobatrachus]|uniref:uncharacterized protein LOC142301270 isoform X1 n=1 Tax=Anomaloglossus baeobatrachus TaxID=238106 RepID=UPI003F507A70
MSLINKSKKFPSLSSVPAIDVFIKVVSGELEKQFENRGVSNLSKKERTALLELQTWHDIQFKPADKGGNVVLWPNELYMKQAHKQLNDRKCYTKLRYNPLAEFKNELLHILTQAYEEGTIPKKMVDVITELHPRLPTLYLIPKIHKNINDPPGRPIVSGKGGLCEIICSVIDFFLKPLVVELPSYIRDTTSVLCQLDDLQLDKNMILVTADVESLYTSIRHQDGIKAAELFLNHSTLEKPMVGLILTLLEFILTHNVFTFDQNIYKQIQGTAMGASCAPSYANLFMGAWERGIFFNKDIPGIKNIHHWNALHGWKTQKNAGKN